MWEKFGCISWKLFCCRRLLEFHKWCFDKLCFSSPCQILLRQNFWVQYFFYQKEWNWISITLYLLPIEFFNFFLENDSFEKGCGRKSILWKWTKNCIRYLCDKIGLKLLWLWKVFISYCIHNWSFRSNCS